MDIEKLNICLAEMDRRRKINENTVIFKYAFTVF